MLEPETEMPGLACGVFVFAPSNTGCSIKPVVKVDPGQEQEWLEGCNPVSRVK